MPNHETQERTTAHFQSTDIIKRFTDDSSGANCRGLRKSLRFLWGGESAVGGLFQNQINPRKQCFLLKADPISELRKLGLPYVSDCHNKAVQACVRRVARQCGG